MIPKLRAWDIENHCMRIVSSINFTHKVIYCMIAELSPFDLGNEISLDDVVLMQSTGLKDKNGIEIYEGDVIHYKHSFRNPMTGSGMLTLDRNFKIIFEDGEFKANGFDMRLKKMISNSEVIGNIYTNPDLLKS